MESKELQRLQVLHLLQDGHMTLREAAERMGVSVRQAKRLKQAFGRDGPKSLVHGNRGRASANRLTDAQRERIIQLVGENGEYQSFNDTHCTEMLAKHHGIDVSRETVRRLRRDKGQPAKRRRRSKKHHARRPRRLHEGDMILWDGSEHRWFGEESEPCCLMAAIDDASSRVVASHFCEHETSADYLRLLHAVITSCGIPLTIYQDRHGALSRNDDHWTLDEQLRGEQDPTQVGMVLRDLGIRPIFAQSPQAKGRVERLFGTLQDRLCAELAHAGITAMEQANAFLPSFIEEHNRRFAEPPANAKPVWRKVPKAIDLDRDIAFRYPAKAGNDNAVRLNGLVIDIPPGPKGRSYAKAHVEVRQRLDGTWIVLFQGLCIAQHQSTPVVDPVKARRRKKPPAKGVANTELRYTDDPPP